jgi:hypothetical protein
LEADSASASPTQALAASAVQCDPSTLSTEALTALGGPMMELRALGFCEAVLLKLPSLETEERIVAISSGPQGEAVCRITWRGTSNDGKAAASVSLVTRFEDGEHIITSTDSAAERYPEGCRVATAESASVTALWRLHCRRCTSKAVSSQPVLLKTYRDSTVAPSVTSDVPPLPVQFITAKPAPIDLPNSMSVKVDLPTSPPNDSSSAGRNNTIWKRLILFVMVLCLLGGAALAGAAYVNAEVHEMLLKTVTSLRSMWKA